VPYSSSLIANALHWSNTCGPDLWADATEPDRLDQMREDTGRIYFHFQEFIAMRQGSKLAMDQERC
jgi:hypothetical protein